MLQTNQQVGKTESCLKMRHHVDAEKRRAQNTHLEVTLLYTYGAYAMTREADHATDGSEILCLEQEIEGSSKRMKRLCLDNVRRR